MHVKSLDNIHLLTVGSEGFYSSSSRGTDFVRDHQLPGIDFATVHAYPDSWYACCKT
jgi:mannan endo-1,4-beta-mannosidase